MSLIQRIINLFSREHLANEIDDELQFHVDMRTEENIAKGMSPAEAKRDAISRFGNSTVIKEKVTDSDVALSFDIFIRDVRYAFRRLLRSPVFAITIILTLALGIGVNTAVFSIVDAVLLRPLPYKNPDRLVVVWQTDAAHRGTGAWFNSYREFSVWLQESQSFEKLAAMSWATTGRTMVWQGQPVNMLALPASVDFFSVLGVSAAIGRTFSSTDLNNPCTLVLSYPFWKEKLGAPNDIIGKTVMVDKSPCVVAGIMPQWFQFYPTQASGWSLITPGSSFERNPWETMTGVFGLVKPGVTRSQAEKELGAIQSRVLPEAPPSKTMLASTMPVVLNLQDNFTWLAGRNLKTGLWVLFGSVSFVLLMTCLNVANLVLSRSMQHSREMAIRTALGASRSRLIRQMMTESLLLALGGTGVGIGIASGALRWFHAVNPIELPPGSVVRLDWKILLVTLCLGIGTVVLFGLLPAWQAARSDVNSVLKSSGNSVGNSTASKRTSEILVVAQIALSLILLTGAGLLTTSLWKMAAEQLDFRTDRIVTSTINLTGARYDDADARSRFASELSSSIASLNGVEEAVTASSVVPLGDNPLSVEGDPSRFSIGGIATQDISPAFLQTMQISLLRGRAFASSDQSKGVPVAIISESLARKYFPNSDPLGRTIKLSRAEDSAQPWLTIVGVASDIKTTSVFQEMGYVEQPTVYRPISQEPSRSLTLLVATGQSPIQLIADMQRKLSGIDRDLVLGGLSTVAEQQSKALSQPRFRAVLLGSFAGLALLLAIIGLYGVLSQMVLKRTREIAIRMALGADRTAILRGVLLRATSLATVGMLIGVPLSILAVRALKGLLYGAQSGSVTTFLLICAVLLLTALAAACIPARRAANVDPLQSLRAE